MAEINVEETLKKLSLSEKVDLLAGIDAWHLKALPQHGIPSVRCSDGPNGVRGTRFFNGVKAACFPCGTGLGATFNLELLKAAGKLMGEEAKIKGAHVILGPTINMQRSPLGGRGFESLGEDPFLAGLGAAAIISGIQSTGIQATIKHFVLVFFVSALAPTLALTLMAMSTCDSTMLTSPRCNDHEHQRNGVQAIITERALREIYALPFQLAVRDANPASFMTAYNGVNGTYCSENKKLLDDMLRRVWGWNGLVMSDRAYQVFTLSFIICFLSALFSAKIFNALADYDGFSGGEHTALPKPLWPDLIWRCLVPHVSDVITDSGCRSGEMLQFNTSSNKVGGHVIDQRARTVLEFIKKCYTESGVEENAPEGTANTPETAALLRRIGNEGIVLLKNDGKTLPFEKDKKTVVIGPNAKIATYHGGGSAALAAYYAITPFDAISSKLTTTPGYSIGQYSHKLLPLLGYSTKSIKGNPGLTMKVYNDGPDVTNREAVDELDLDKTEMNLMDYNNPHLKSELWYATFEGSMVAEEDCTYELGLVVCGTANLYVNNELVIDNSTKQILGEAFFGVGTIEEKGFYKMEKGKTYKFKITFGSTPTSKLGGEAVLFRGGVLRVGGCKVIDPKAEIERAAALAKEADQVIICSGLNADWESEGHDRANMDLPPGTNEFISAVAKANPNTAVVMQSGTPVEMPWIKEVNAVIQAWYGGNETGNTISDVLFGDVNPSGKLSLSFPVRVQDNPAFLNYRTEGGRVLYGEDIYIGYRFYDFSQREVLFPFGHGLSYTTFSFSDLSITHKDDNLTVAVTVKNTGSVKGAEVAQLYVSPKQKTKVNRPVKEMKGFAKVELESGQSKTVMIEVPTKYAACYWDEDRDQWCVEKGEYEVIVSDSSEIKEQKAVIGSFEVSQTYWWSGI